MAPPAKQSAEKANLYATPTQGKFIVSDATIVVIAGPMGEGKSLAGVIALFKHLERCLPALKALNVPLDVAVIRDTHENIKRSVVKVFNEFFGAHPNIRHAWRNDYKKLTIFTNPKIECDLFGIDDTTALTKLQGSAYSCIWIDDPVPYTDSERTNAGIDQDTFNAALVRCARQAGMKQGLKPRLQLTTNMPDEDHWFNKRLLEPPDGPVHPQTPDITKEVFHIPYGENMFLSDISRQATIAAYAGDDVATARFVHGLVATRYAGMRVAENFKDKTHVAEYELKPFKGYDGFVSFDSWGNPAAVIGQQAPNGRVYIMDIVQGAEDIRGLIRDYVKPLLNTPKWKEVCRHWRYMGDCTMRQPDQSDVSQSAAAVIEEEFKDEVTGEFAPFEPGPATWEHVKSGLLHSLRWTIAGEAAVTICPVNCKALIAGLRGRWHYPVNKAGVRTSNKPVKDRSSHICDAFANACCVLAAWDPPKRYQKKRTEQRRFKERRRAQSYAA